MQQLTDEVLKFRSERNWEQFHTPKDLAISISLEASELLECFQWKSSEEALQEKFHAMKDEIADIVIYALLLSHDLNIDITEAVESKLLKNAEKYPVDKAYGTRKKYTDL